MKRKSRYTALAEVMLRSFENPRWICHGCGAKFEITGPAYPICRACGLRCRFIDVQNAPYVSTPIAPPSLEPTQ